MSIGFDKLAPWYGVLERILFGPRLQEMRCAYLKRLSGVGNILLIGEGTGLFLDKLLKFNPEAKVTVVESSFSMIECSRKRVSSEDYWRVTFHQTSFAKFESVQPFDALCTFFFWDCFEEYQLREMLPSLSKLTNSESFWIDVDFFERLDKSQKINLSHFILIRILYGFFGLATGIEARQVAEIEPMAKENGFFVTESRLAEKSPIRARIFRKRISPPRPI